MKHADFKSLEVALPAEQMERLDEAVRSGEYASKEEIVVEALRLWHESHTAESETAWLRREHEEGLASGLAEDLSKEELLARFKAEFYRG